MMTTGLAFLATSDMPPTLAYDIVCAIDQHIEDGLLAPEDLGPMMEIRALAKEGAQLIKAEEERDALERTPPRFNPETGMWEIWISESTQAGIARWALPGEEIDDTLKRVIAGIMSEPAELRDRVLDDHV